MSAFASSPTLRNIASDTADEVAAIADADGRAKAIIFERLLVPRLVENSKKISAETIAALAGKEGVPVALEIRPGVGSTADCLVVWRFANNLRSTVVVNVKRVGTNTGHTELAALSGFIRLATDVTYEANNPPKDVVDGGLEVVRWVAGRRKIQPGRDLYVLVAFIHDDGKLSDVKAVGALAAINRNRPAVQRHRTRDVVKMQVKTTSVIPDEYDVNHEISCALLPRPKPGDLRAVLLATLSKGCCADEMAKAANQLLDLSDAEIVERLRGAFTTIAED